MGDQTHQRWAWGLQTSCWFMFNCIAYVWTQQTNNANLVVPFICEQKIGTHCALNPKKRRIKPEKRSGLHHPIECTEYAFAYANKKKSHVNWSPFSFFLIFNSRSHGAENAFLLFPSHFYSFASILFFLVTILVFCFLHAWRANPTNREKKQRSPSYIYF